MRYVPSTFSLQVLVRVVEEFMQNRCWMGLVPEWAMPAEVDTMLRATGARNQAGVGLAQGCSRHVLKSIELFIEEVKFVPCRLPWRRSTWLAGST